MNHSSERIDITGLHRQEGVFLAACHNTEINIPAASHSPERSSLVACHSTEINTVAAGHSPERSSLAACHGTEINIVATGHSPERSSLAACHSTEINIVAAGHSPERRSHHTDRRSSDQDDREKANVLISFLMFQFFSPGFCRLDNLIAVIVTIC
jgi:hypothetical protein